MRITSLLLLTSLTSIVACGGDDAEDTSNTLGSDPSSETSATMSATSPSESSSDDTLTTTTPGSESGSESGGSESGSSESGPGPVDTSGSESGNPVDECANYCTLFQTNCDGGIGGSDPYTDEAACLTACEGFTTDGLECRTGHLDGTAVNAKNLDAAYYMTHCPHGDVDGSGVCPA